jgi:hypothetical protein
VQTAINALPTTTELHANIATMQTIAAAMDPAPLLVPDSHVRVRLDGQELHVTHVRRITMDQLANFAMQQHAVLRVPAHHLGQDTLAHALRDGQGLLAIPVLPTTTDPPANIVMQAHAVIMDRVLLLELGHHAHAAPAG